MRPLNYVSRAPAEHVQISHAGRRATGCFTYICHVIRHTYFRFASFAVLRIFIDFSLSTLRLISNTPWTSSTDGGRVTPRAAWHEGAKLKLNNSGLTEWRQRNVARLNDDAVNIRYNEGRGGRRRIRQKMQNVLNSQLCNFVSILAMRRILPISWSLSVVSSWHFN